jgi:tRNA wybutosine-synthesizing protein 2
MISEKLSILLENKIPQNLISFLPNRWWKVGDVLISTIPEELMNYTGEIGEAFLKLESNVRVVLGKTGPTKGVTRKPGFTHLAGEENTVTTHKELGCLFKIDAAKLTFSPGNHGERNRLLEITGINEFIVDMFSCIGNLSLPLAVHKQPKMLIAAEINPLAHKYLEQNIKLNKVQDHMKSILGDNRMVLEDYYQQADRVLSGYLASDLEQITVGVKLCKKGGILHFHAGVPNNKEILDNPINKIKKIVEQENRTLEVINQKRVKKYSPGIDHIVIDIKIF